jgi:glycosyltransferase 2 family protein
MSASARRPLQLAIGVAVVIAVAATVGTGSFVRGLTAVTPAAIVAAVLLSAVGTAAAAYRWQAVAGGLGLRLPWGAAIAAYYRSQFLNSVLVGGVVGDVHRAYRHGRESGSTGLAARAVVTERIAGQVVQVTIAILVLVSFGLGSQLRGMAWLVGGVVALVGIAIAVAAATARGRRVLSREFGVVRRVFADPRRSLAVAGSSIVVIASLSAIFVIACLAVGVRLPLADLIALALVALSAAALPINVGGWGPREAAAASAFAIVGLGAQVGVAASTAFGVLTLISVAPGAVILLIDRIPSPSPSVIPEETIA